MLVVIFLHAEVLKSQPYSIMHVFGFFMPWFFFKAGMFHKEDQKYTKSLFLKLAKRFVIPSCTYLIINRGDTVLLWFLEALVISKLIFIALPKSKSSLIKISLFLFLVGDLINRYEPNIPLLLKEIPMALFYYIVGFLLKKLRCDSKMIACLLLVYLMLLLVIPSRADMRMQTILFGYFEIAVAGCLVGILLMNALCVRYQDYLFKPVVYIGSESMSYYILHMPIIIVTHFFFTKVLFVNYANLISAITVLITVPIIVYVLDRLRLSWILGKVEK